MASMQRVETYPITVTLVFNKKEEMKGDLQSNLRRPNRSEMVAPKKFASIAQVLYPADTMSDWELLKPSDLYSRVLKLLITSTAVFCVAVATTHDSIKRVR